ncbi:nucleotidyltransferase family protein [Aerococcus agrisoli]|uniref:Nucleotidyltransferase family protein n=1 Tax=Aerococcus agrisoli TaxID=2487350 RepID=A0A3N4GJC8_9LACT|nr:nucleotidyltransferase family protein [Aerococcus agrisoli]RPA60686.1 nucleotidyltransferase family protein [Aerococcus agrisoli]
MKAIILAAGYATRLYPLTKNQPKPLLKVGNQTILDSIVEKMVAVEELDEIFIVTNDKFHTHFEEWAKEATYDIKLTVINDGTLSNEDRLGALGDIHFVIEQAKVEDDLMIAAGDNLFGFSLVDLVSFYKAHEGNAISIYKEDDLKQLVRGGTADIDKSGKIIGFEEKPAQVNYPYAVPTFYIIQKEDLILFDAYKNEGHNMDANGNFIPYLLDHSSVYGFVFDEYRYDIGTLESYEQVQKLFTNDEA